MIGRAREGDAPALLGKGRRKPTEIQFRKPCVHTQGSQERAVARSAEASFRHLAFGLLRPVPFFGTILFVSTESTTQGPAMADKYSSALQRGMVRRAGSDEYAGLR